jgi:hypothetical protein
MLMQITLSTSTQNTTRNNHLAEFYVLVIPQWCHRRSPQCLQLISRTLARKTQCARLRNPKMAVDGTEADVELRRALNDGEIGSLLPASGPGAKRSGFRL